MKRASRDPREHPAAQQLVLKALRNERSAPRQHHIIPNAYLRRWAEAGNVRVTEIGSRRTWVTSTDRAGRERDYYRIESDDVDPEELPPLLFETLLSEIEGLAQPAMDELRDRSASEVDPRLLSHLFRYLAFQLTRGEGFRAGMRALANETFALTYGGLTRDGARDLLRRQRDDVTEEDIDEALEFTAGLRSGNYRVVPQDAAIIGMSGEMAQEVAPYILFRSWVVFETPAVLITSDEPVVLVGGPGMPRDESAGVATAGVILFPFAPDRLLALFRYELDPGIERDSLTLHETTEINREIAMAGSRWLFERPSKKLASKFDIPTSPAATIFDEPFELEDGRTVIRSYRPNRWRKVTATPWPVARWWEGVVAHGRPEPIDVTPFIQAAGG